jgi:hypothetical protein
MRWYATWDAELRRRSVLQGKADTYDKDELEVVYKGPLDGVAILFVSFIGGPALDKGLADEGVDGGDG